VSDAAARLRALYLDAGLLVGDSPTYVADCCARAASCWSDEPASRRPPASPSHRGEAYAPWIGPQYEATRLVVVGENFYEHGGWDEASNLVRWVMPQLAAGVRRMNFGAKGYKGSLFQHRSAEYARIWLGAVGHVVTIGEVYNHIAFTNHVKCCPRSDNRGRSRPNEQMWANCGRHILAHELEILGARRVVVVGTSWNAWAFRSNVWPGLRSARRTGRVELLRDDLGREVLVVPHPASRGGGGMVDRLGGGGGLRIAAACCHGVRRAVGYFGTRRWWNWNTRRRDPPRTGSCLTSSSRIRCGPLPEWNMRPHPKHRVSCALALSLLACGGGTRDEPTGTIPGVVIEDFDPVPSCPDDLYVLGTADAFAQDYSEFTWEYDRENNISYSPMFYAEVAEDTVSLALTLDAGSTPAAFLTLEIGGEVWLEGDWGSPPLQHWPDLTPSLVFPMNDYTYPAPGCFAAMAVVPDEDVSGDTATLYMTTRRYVEHTGILDLNFIVVDGTEVYEDELADAVAVMTDLYWNGNGPEIGDVYLYSTDHPSGSVLDIESDDLAILRSTITDGAAQAMNVFFISDFTEPGTLGIAAGIPGALGIEGTPGSGVVVAVDGHLDGSGSVVDTQLLGETIAHEVGHQMGLFHTTESDGAHDPIDDTPACPMSQDSDNDGTLNASECTGYDGYNFMFWSGGVTQDQMSTTQSDVLYFSPIVQ
jgi:hypothetical protein